MDGASNADLARRIFSTGPARLALVRAAWSTAVGPEVARRSEVLIIEGTTLRVRVPDAGWKRVLHGMQRDVLLRLRRVVGSLAPRRLGFTIGPVSLEAEPEEVRVATASQPPIPEGLAAEAKIIADPALREQFLRTAALYLDSCREGREGQTARRCSPSSKAPPKRGRPDG